MGGSVGRLVNGSTSFWFSDTVIWWGGESLGLLNGRQPFGCLSLGAVDGLVVSWVAGELDCLVGWFVSGSGGSFGRTVGTSVSQMCGWVFQFLGLSLWLLLGCWSVCGLGSHRVCQ